MLFLLLELVIAVLCGGLLISQTYWYVLNRLNNKNPDPAGRWKNNAISVVISIALLLACAKFGLGGLIFDIIIAERKAPMLAPEPNPAPPAPFQFLPGLTRSPDSVAAEVIILADQAVALSQKGDCAGADKPIRRLGALLENYKINILLGVPHSETEMRVQTHVANALREHSHCNALNSARDPEALR